MFKTHDAPNNAEELVSLVARFQINYETALFHRWRVVVELSLVREIGVEWWITSQFHK